MSTRYLVAVALMFGSACGAHADVLSTTASTDSGFLSGWTTGSGTDVVSSGVLGSGATLVGGAAYGSGTLAQSLYEKASASVGSSASAVTLSYTSGIEGTYLVGTSNAKLAAMLGNGVSVVSSSGGYVVTGGASTGSTSGGGAATGVTGSTGATSGSTTTTGSTSGSTSGSTTGGSTTSAGDTSTGIVSGGPLAQLPSDTSSADVGAGLPTVGVNAAGDVPEPSSIALLLAGLMGAVAVTRRRAR